MHGGAVHHRHISSLLLPAGTPAHIQYKSIAEVGAAHESSRRLAPLLCRLMIAEMHTEAHVALIALLPDISLIPYRWGYSEK